MSVLKDINKDLWRFIGEYIGHDEIIDAAMEFASPEDKAQSIGIKRQPAASIGLNRQTLNAITEEPLFTEWLWTEYVAPGLSKSFIEEYYDKRSGVLPASTRLLLKQFLDTQRYTLWQVKTVEPGRIEMVDLKLGTHHIIREYAMAKGVKRNDCVFVRIARQGDHWEIVSSDGILPINIQDAETAQNLANQLPDLVSAKQSLTYIAIMKRLMPDTAVPAKHTDVPLAEARDAFDAVTKTCGIDQYIDRRQVEKLMRDELASDDALKTGMPAATQLLLGLLDEEHPGFDQQTSDMLTASNDLWNSLRPAKFKRHAGTGTLEFIETNLWSWQEGIQDAIDAASMGDTEKAVESWETVFRTMLEASGTSRSLYRHYGNAAVAYLMDGNTLLGERLLDIALEICPAYDFALGQKRKVGEGYYQAAMFRKMQERIQSGKLELPESSDALRKLSDAELTARFAKLELNVDKNTFGDLIPGTQKADDLLVGIWGIDKNDRRIDHAHVLAVEAARRWMPARPWPETVELITGDLYEALFPQLPGARRSVKRAESLINELYASIQNAPPEFFTLWMHENGSYSEDRQNIAYAAFEFLRLDKSGKAVVADILKLLHTRTDDPIFLAPAIVMKAEDGKTIKQDLSYIARSVPTDETSLGFIGQMIAAEYKEPKEQALVGALEIVDRRKTQHIYTSQPYSRSSIQDGYKWVLGELCELYEGTNQPTLLKKYQKQYDQIMQDHTLAQTSSATPEEIEKRGAGYLDHELFVDNPLISYYEWFKTLGIDLSSGDGSKTHFTFTRISDGSGHQIKIGRNDPCPCGATKPDGSPQKYKKCHGAS